MGKLQVTDYFTYKYRYQIGYGFIGLALIALLVIAGLYIPGGLSQAEMESVVRSSTVHLSEFATYTIADLPYYLLQKASLAAFGMTVFSIKLPSLILGFASALGMFFLLRRWFRHNIAVIASALTITTGQFLFVSQSGTPSIMSIFWSIYLLLAAMMIARKARFNTLWTYGFFIAAALSLYTPLSIYVLFAIVSAALLHPHLRFMLRQLPKLKLVGASLVSLLLVVPLAYGIYQTPKLGLQLLGIPATWPDFSSNAMQLVSQYLDVISPTSGSVMTPIFGFGSIALIVFGLFHIIRARHTARSYIISVWGLLLIPILVINPNFVSITFVPLLLLLATGVHTLLREWYKLFPKNPYARIAGLLPLVVLIGGLLLSGIERYAYGYHYDPLTATNFSKDLILINRELRTTTGNVALVTTPKNYDFYQVLAKNTKTHRTANLTVTTAAPTKSDIIIVDHDQHTKTRPSLPLKKIITDSHSRAADRFYIYKNTSK